MKNLAAASNVQQVNKNTILKYWKKRKEKQEAEQRTWDEKMKKLEDNSRELQEEIRNET